MMAAFRVHNVGFYHPEPLAIHCIAYNKHYRKIALSRSDGSVEVWNFRCNNLFAEKVIPAESGRSIESLAWCQNRLFSVGLTGLITEYDLLHLKPKKSTPTSFGACWCIAPNKEETSLAVCTEEGYLSIFNVLNDTVEYEKSLDKQEGRIMCLAWHENGNIIVTGSIDAIRVWNVKTGHAIQRIVVGRQSRKTETIVWSVAFTRDFQIVSGDSTGNVSFWDAEKGVLISSVKSHTADVLCIAVEENGRRIYASGVDPQIVLFERAHLSKKWVKCRSRIHHSHDVRALAMAENYLVSGGVDTNLIISKYPPKITLKFPPFLQTPCLHLAPKASIILLQYSTWLEIWRLGNTHETSGEDKCRLSLSSNHLKLVDFKAKPGEIIVASALSNDAQWLAYSTTVGLRVFQLVMENPGMEKPKITLLRIHSLPKECLSARCLAFNSTGTKLLSLLPSGELQILAMDYVQLTLIHQFKPDELSVGCHIMSVSMDGKFVAVGYHDGQVKVFNISNYQVHCSLPNHFPPTAMAFVPNEVYLVIAYQDRKVVAYDINSRQFATWSNTLSLASSLKLDVSEYVFRGITFTPTDENLVILHDCATIYIINKKILSDRCLQNNSEKLRSLESAILKKSSRFSYLVHFLNLRDDFMVALEVSPIALMQKLPPTLKKKKFGT